MQKRRVTDIIFSLHKRVSSLNYFHFRRYRILKKSSILHHQFLCQKHQNSVKNIISVKNCVKNYVSNFLKRFIFNKGKEYQNHARRQFVHNSHTLFPVFYKNNFIRTKALILAKKNPQKIRTKPGLLSYRILEQSVQASHS